MNTSKNWKAISWLAIIFLVSGCANLPSNQPLVRPSSPAYDYNFKSWIVAREKLSDDLIVVSFSGGGLRASTLSMSVLNQLKALGLANKIAIISSTSGGSVTAGYFAATGPDGIEAFRNQFLYNNNTSDLTFRLLPSLLSGANRSEQFADYLDERLFQSKPLKYRDLMERWKDGAPFVVLNASDASSGRTFEFTQESFSHLCSDLAPFRVSEAMAASAAFPFLMTPIPLLNHWNDPKCRDNINPFSAKEYNEAVKNRYIDLENFVRARYIHSLRYTYENDPTQEPYRRIRYLHLIDGGLSDNLAARALLRTFDADTVKALQEKGVKRILLVQVNAKSDKVRKIDSSGSIPSWIEIFKTVALNPIDVTTMLSSYISGEYWVSLIEYINAKANKDTPQKKDVLRFYPVQVDFDQMNTNSKEQRDVKNIDTNWTLSKDEVALVEKTGKNLLMTHPCFKTFLWESSSSYKVPGAEPSGCDTIVVTRRNEAPTAVAAAIAPHPPVMEFNSQITLAAETLFDFDTAMFKPEGRRILNDLLGKLRAFDVERVVVIGHTDRLGLNTYNNKLSMRRANSVKAYLVTSGISAERVITVSKGNTEPVTKPGECKGSPTKEVIKCLQPNRRVEIEVIGRR